ncbi:chemotaxis protein CheW [Rugamonas sp. CCM 8940]|uniref:chemotaxis protein CheW n=1 Tax=Rugamonas sp. CCM 8940 TaxID=2765359 RepID=UPI0018F75DA1|nr:chemotaxis protein CheW [Rugamonas sp. CCM 8940]MBJ7310176.1 purine-binding chemotaxis protein CheW [Rugamonas sp. CCM 8940]
MGALPVVTSASPQVAAQYLTFLLGADMFAIGILAVKEIIEYGGVTALPGMPACISGVINLRGAAVPVLDLARRLDRAPGPVTKRTCIIVLEVAADDGAFVIGILVDAVQAVVDIGAADIEPAPSFGAQVRAELLLGIGKIGGRFVLLLDVQHVVAGSEIAALAAAGGAPPPLDTELAAPAAAEPAAP